MRLAFSLLSVLTVLSSSDHSSPLDPTQGIQALPFHEIDLKAFEKGVSSATLEERREVKICGQKIHIPETANCISGVGSESWHHNRPAGFEQV